MDYREVLGRVNGLQRGFTSGTCALAAARAAALTLFSGDILSSVEVELDTLKLMLPVKLIKYDEGSALYSIIKDSGDDSDVTNGTEFRAEVSISADPGVFISGGVGVGHVTRRGLPVPIGESAINPGPRKRITDALNKIVPAGQGVHAVLSVPDGETLAKKTWNPRLGIEGGISIIGTSGIIEPKSTGAYKASIALCIRVIKENYQEQKGAAAIYLVSGYVGSAYFQGRNIGEEQIVKVADHIGFALDEAAANGFGRIVLAAHIGKMAKLASGIFNTHCSCGDGRLETIAAFAAAAGGKPSEIRAILRMKTAEESVGYLNGLGLNAAFDLINGRLLERCLSRINRPVILSSVILDLEGNVLSQKSLNSMDEE